MKAFRSELIEEEEKKSCFRQLSHSHYIHYN